MQAMFNIRPQKLMARVRLHALSEQREKKMKYEDKILDCFDCEVILRTELNLTDEDSKISFDKLAERLKGILRQIELHEDYEELLADRKRLNKIQDILIDRMQNDADKEYELKREIEGELEEDSPF